MSLCDLVPTLRAVSTSTKSHYLKLEPPLRRSRKMLSMLVPDRRETPTRVPGWVRVTTRVRVRVTVTTRVTVTVTRVAI